MDPPLPKIATRLTAGSASNVTIAFSTRSEWPAFVIICNERDQHEAARSAKRTARTRTVFPPPKLNPCLIEQKSPRRGSMCVLFSDRKRSKRDGRTVRVS